VWKYQIHIGGGNMETSNAGKHDEGGRSRMFSLQSDDRPAETRKVGRPKKTEGGTSGAGRRNPRAREEMTEFLDKILFWTQLNVYYSMNSSTEFDKFVSIMENTRQEEIKRRHKNA
jgi:hypothetical protein